MGRKVWRRIEIGGQTTEGLRTLLCNVFVSADAQDLWDRIPLEENTLRIVKLVLLTNADLSLPAMAKMGEVFQRAFEEGLQRCPPEVGIVLRTVLKRQAKRGRNRGLILIGMEPVKVPAYIGQFPCPPLDEHRIFALGNDPELGLTLHAPDTAKGNAIWVDPHVWAFQMA